MLRDRRVMNIDGLLIRKRNLLSLVYTDAGLVLLICVALCENGSCAAVHRHTCRV